MLRLFSKIRYRLAAENNLAKYTRYAIGEILLVVVGILIALQVNNWKDVGKSNKMVKEVYANLLTSLVQDSLEVQKVIGLFGKSLNAQSNLIKNESKVYSGEINQIELDKLMEEIIYGIISFFPKTGIYELITSNNSLDLLKSQQIKSLLINLYDFQYKRYEKLDASIDNKFHNELNSLIREKIKFVGTFNSESEFTILNHSDSARFKEHYYELISECRDGYPLLSTASNYLLQISESINELIELIRVELKK